MRRIEYINSTKGQIHQRFKRRIRRIYLDVKQEPKGKNSISLEEKIAFQQQIINKMKNYKRRYFRSPLILKIDFYCNQDNPPGIHTLAKNYLDLLEKPVTTGFHRKRVLYENDRNIKILIVGYHLKSELRKSEILIEADTLSNFLIDLLLLNKIKNNDFSDANHLFTLDHSQRYESIHEDSYNYHETGFELVDLRRNKTLFMNKFGEDTYKILLDFAIWDNQRKFLSLSRINVKKLLLLFYNLIEQKELAGGISSSDIINEYIIDRDLIVFPPFSIDLTHIPTREGDRLSFKENISNSLNDFKRTYPIMYPLRTLLSVSILCIPPRIQGIDLDNLARYIIPLVNDILKPLSYYQFTIDIDNIKDRSLKEKYEKELKNARRIPKHSVTRYQIIEIPRLDKDLPEGQVWLILENGEDPESIWEKVDKSIDKWEKDIEDVIYIY